MDPSEMVRQAYVIEDGVSRTTRMLRYVALMKLLPAPDGEEWVRLPKPSLDFAFGDHLAYRLRDSSLQVVTSAWEKDGAWLIRVSVTARKREPTAEEIALVKQAFVPAAGELAVVQVEGERINPLCVHLSVRVPYVMPKAVREGIADYCEKGEEPDYAAIKTQVRAEKASPPAEAGPPAPPPAECVTTPSPFRRSQPPVH